jgi:hypothetical protein
MKRLLVALTVACLGTLPSQAARAGETEEVRPIPTRAGLTVVSLFADGKNDLISKSFSMSAGTSMGMHVMVFANTARLGAFNANDTEGSFFHSEPTAWPESSFAAVPVEKARRSKEAVALAEEGFEALEIHAGNCWREDVQFFQKYRGAKFIATYAVEASTKVAPDQNGRDDLAGGTTEVQVYRLGSLDGSDVGFAGFADALIFKLVITTSLRKTSCDPAEMTPEYVKVLERLRDEKPLPRAG